MLQALLSEGRPLLADGATGTNLFEVGLASGETPELWNGDQPGKIRALIQSFVDAGSDIVLTNSFGGNRRRLMLHKLEHRARELNRLAAEIAREVADKASRRVVVGGSVGPTGDLLAPLGPLSEDEAAEVFAEQIAGLKEGGADVVWIETMSAPEEIRAAAKAASDAGMPYVATASFDTAGRTMMGLSPDAYAEMFDGFATAPLAFGANCGVGASDLLVSVLGMTEKRPGANVVAKANAGVPQWHGAHIHYSGTPELMADYARLAVDAGAKIVGGCCGNTPVHVAAMRRALDSHPASSGRPSVEAIVAALGPLVSPPAQGACRPARAASLAGGYVTQTFEVLEAARLDRFLAEVAEGFSRTRLKALIEGGHVRLDGARADNPSQKVAPGAVVTLDAPPAQDTEIAGEDIPLAVVYEDDHLIVIDKPPGLVTHPAPGHASGTLVNALIRHCGASLSGIGGVKRPGIVHRLDKDTSGLLVVAKTDAAHRGLADLFADHGRTGTLVREYVALAWNGFPARAGVVDAPLGRHPYSRERMAVVAEGKGRHAITHWQVEEALGAAALLRLRLETGRTHQIRVHLAHIGHPLLGDATYGAGFKTKANRLSETAREALTALNRQALHAASLGFAHPATGQPMHFEAPPPDDFMNLAEALRV